MKLLFLILISSVQTVKTLDVITVEKFAKIEQESSKSLQSSPQKCSYSNKIRLLDRLTENSAEVLIDSLNESTGIDSDPIDQEISKIIATELQNQSQSSSVGSGSILSLDLKSPMMEDEKGLKSILRNSQAVGVRYFLGCRLDI